MQRSRNADAYAQGCPRKICRSPTALKGKGYRYNFIDGCLPSVSLVRPCLERVREQLAVTVML